MLYVNETSCCGVREFDCVDDYDDPLQLLLRFCVEENVDGNFLNYAFVVFTDRVNSKRGQKLANYIVKNNLGRIVESRAKINPNTSNKIKVWIWDIDNINLKRWYKKNEDFKDKNYDW